jgi:hypothetical protein
MANASEHLNDDADNNNDNIVCTQQKEPSQWVRH